MLALWLLIALALALALFSLRGDAAKARHWRRTRTQAHRCPPVTLIVPVKGHDEGLRENLAALAAQHYPDFELIVCARAAADVPAGVVPPGARLVFSSVPEPHTPAPHTPAPHTGEKIQNLLAAVDATRPSSEVLAFADSDARPLAHWLASLVSVALDPDVGVATGYRWYIPARGGFWSHARSAWNSVIAGGFGPGQNAFCWGGAMAIRRELFERLNVRAAWRNQASDDYALSARVREAGLKIGFAPGALTPARDHSAARELFHWTARQLRITRVYRPGLWRIALAAHLVYCAALPAAVVLAAAGHPWALAALALQLAIGMTKAARRCAWASAALGEPAGSALVHAVLSPFVTWVWLASLLASAAGNVIEWRGVRYRLACEGCRRLG